MLGTGETYSHSLRLLPSIAFTAFLVDAGQAVVSRRIQVEPDKGLRSAGLKRKSASSISQRACMFLVCRSG